MTSGEGSSEYKAVVDRIEGDYAVLELIDHTTLDFPLRLLPGPVKEGDSFFLKIQIRDS